ncbi:unnamed protein product [Amoebophrya sp. A25]|nr:unnamed protein product [Amoebophrya sp. A25]|eukprot:GSA25T00016971001.1
MRRLDAIRSALNKQVKKTTSTRGGNEILDTDGGRRTSVPAGRSAIPSFGDIGAWYVDPGKKANGGEAAIRRDASWQQGIANAHAMLNFYLQRTLLEGALYVSRTPAPMASGMSKMSSGVPPGDGNTRSTGTRRATDETTSRATPTSETTSRAAHHQRLLSPRLATWGKWITQVLGMRGGALKVLVNPATGVQERVQVALTMYADGFLTELDTTEGDDDGDNDDVDVGAPQEQKEEFEKSDETQEEGTGGKAATKSPWNRVYPEAEWSESWEELRQSGKADVLFTFPAVAPLTDMMGPTTAYAHRTLDKNLQFSKGRVREDLDEAETESETRARTFRPPRKQVLLNEFSQHSPESDQFLWGVPEENWTSVISRGVAKTLIVDSKKQEVDVPRQVGGAQQKPTKAELQGDPMMTVFGMSSQDFGKPELLPEMERYLAQFRDFLILRELMQSMASKMDVLWLDAWRIQRTAGDEDVTVTPSSTPARDVPKKTSHTCNMLQKVSELLGSLKLKDERDTPSFFAAIEGLVGLTWSDMSALEIPLGIPTGTRETVFDTWRPSHLSERTSDLFIENLFRFFTRRPLVGSSFSAWGSVALAQDDARRDDDSREARRELDTREQYRERDKEFAPIFLDDEVLKKLRRIQLGQLRQGRSFGMSDPRPIRDLMQDITPEPTAMASTRSTSSTRPGTTTRLGSPPQEENNMEIDRIQSVFGERLREAGSQVYQQLKTLQEQGRKSTNQAAFQLVRLWADKVIPQSPSGTGGGGGAGVGGTRGGSSTTSSFFTQRLDQVVRQKAPEAFAFLEEIMRTRKGGGGTTKKPQRATQEQQSKGPRGGAHPDERYGNAYKHFISLHKAVSSTDPFILFSAGPAVQAQGPQAEHPCPSQEQQRDQQESEPSQPVPPEPKPSSSGASSNRPTVPVLFLDDPNLPDQMGLVKDIVELEGVHNLEQAMILSSGDILNKLAPKLAIPEEAKVKDPKLDVHFRQQWIRNVDEAITGNVLLDPLFDEETSPRLTGASRLENIALSEAFKQVVTNNEAAKEKAKIMAKAGGADKDVSNFVTSMSDKVRGIVQKAKDSGSLSWPMIDYNPESEQGKLWNFPPLGGGLAFIGNTYAAETNWLKQAMMRAIAANEWEDSSQLLLNDDPVYQAFSPGGLYLTLDKRMLLQHLHLNVNEGEEEKEEEDHVGRSGGTSRSLGGASKKRVFYTVSNVFRGLQVSMQLVSRFMDEAKLQEDRRLHNLIRELRIRQGQKPGEEAVSEAIWKAKDMDAQELRKHETFAQWLQRRKNTEVENAAATKALTKGASSFLQQHLPTSRSTSPFLESFSGNFTRLEVDASSTEMDERQSGTSTTFLEHTMMMTQKIHLKMKPRGRLGAGQLQAVTKEVPVKNEAPSQADKNIQASHKAMLHSLLRLFGIVHLWNSRGFISPRAKAAAVAILQTPSALSLHKNVLEEFSLDDGSLGEAEKLQKAALEQRLLKAAGRAAKPPSAKIPAPRTVASILKGLTLSEAKELREIVNGLPAERDQLLKRMNEGKAMTANGSADFRKIKNLKGEDIHIGVSSSSSGRGDEDSDEDPAHGGIPWLKSAWDFLQNVQQQTEEDQKNRVLKDVQDKLSVYLGLPGSGVPARPEKMDKASPIFQKKTKQRIIEVAEKVATEAMNQIKNDVKDAFRKERNEQQRERQRFQQKLLQEKLDGKMASASAQEVDDPVLQKVWAPGTEDSKLPFLAKVLTKKWRLTLHPDKSTTYPQFKDAVEKGLTLKDIRIDDKTGPLTGEEDGKSISIAMPDLIEKMNAIVAEEILRRYLNAYWMDFLCAGKNPASNPETS